MKKLMFPALVLILALGLTGLIACGSGGTEVVEEEEEEEATPENEEEESEEQTSGGGLTWSDVPVYPGASQISKGSWAIPPAEGEWAKVEWHYYESNDSHSKIASFYRSRMSDNGWIEQGWFEAGEIFWGFFEKNNEQDAAMVWTGSEGNKSVIAVMRATK